MTGEKVSEKAGFGYWKLFSLNSKKKTKKKKPLFSRYAPVILGMSNTFGQAAGFMGPLTTGLVLRGGNSHHNWMRAFWITALVYVPGQHILQARKSSF